MLETTHPWGSEVLPFFSPNVTAQVVGEPWQLAAYYDLRRAIFAEEQGLFEESDVDEHDAYATPIVALGHVAGMPDAVIGAVRIYPRRAAPGGERESGTWYGGRLGVCPRYRSRRVVGTALICAAVSTAHALGSTRFLATIQLRNVRYFEKHHFATLQPVEVCGQPHHLMEADLRAYPPCAALPDQPLEGERATRLVQQAQERAGERRTAA
jgi:putative N-acetyltransferase (TIGR04045 family)